MKKKAKGKRRQVKGAQVNDLYIIHAGMYNENSNTC